MTDLISRQAAIDALNTRAKDTFTLADGYQYYLGALHDVADDLRQLPSAQPERKKGRWINHRNDNGHNIADCDKCGKAMQWFDDDIKPNYCPNCGADMRGDT